MVDRIEEIGAKMDALGVWEAAMPCHWAVKPRGSAFPYFCCTLKGEIAPVKVRFLLLDGWQTFHDFVRTRLDHDFGFYSQPVEFPHFELIILQRGEMKLFRHDTGYVPREVNARERELCAKMLWEAYGVLLRLESDSQLPLKFADSQSMFARVERTDGVWCDEPIEIPRPRPHVEQVSFSKKTLAAAKDLPLRSDEVLELNFCLVPGLVTRESKPRIIYLLAAVNAKTGEVVFRDKLAVEPEGGLRAMWESLAPRVLTHLVERRAVPGELRVASGRLFRLLRPLCLELPFKLAKVASLSHIGEALRNLS